MTFVVRSERAGTEGFLTEVRQAVWSVNPTLPAAGLQTMRDIYGRSLARTSFTVIMLVIAGGMALLLGVIGISGVIAYAVSHRRREISIRLALGAPRRKLRSMFVRQGSMLFGAGAIIGLAACKLHSGAPCIVSRAGGSAAVRIVRQQNKKAPDEEFHPGLFFVFTQNVYSGMPGIGSGSPSISEPSAATATGKGD
ncbi:MAG TPA: FtsX-like permease family protein [Bryobacteraceae bacterium]